MADQGAMTDDQRLEALRRERERCVADEVILAQQLQVIESSHARSHARFPEQPEDLERCLDELTEVAEAKKAEFERMKTAFERKVEAQVANIAAGRFPLGPELRDAYLMTMRGLRIPQVFNAVNASRPDLNSYAGWLERQETLNRNEQDIEAMKPELESLVRHAQSLSSDVKKLADNNIVRSAVVSGLAQWKDRVKSSEAKVTELTNANTALSQDKMVLQRQVDESERIINELRAENERLRAANRAVADGTSPSVVSDALDQQPLATPGVQSASTTVDAAAQPEIDQGVPYSLFPRHRVQNSAASTAPVGQATAGPAGTAAGKPRSLRPMRSFEGELQKKMPYIGWLRNLTRDAVFDMVSLPVVWDDTKKADFQRSFLAMLYDPTKRKPRPLHEVVADLDKVAAGVRDETGARAYRCLFPTLKRLGAAITFQTDKRSECPAHRADSALLSDRRGSATEFCVYVTFMDGVQNPCAAQPDEQFDGARQTVNGLRYVLVERV